MISPIKFEMSASEKTDIHYITHFCSVRNDRLQHDILSRSKKVSKMLT